MEIDAADTKKDGTHLYIYTSAIAFAADEREEISFACAYVIEEIMLLVTLFL